MQFHFHAPSEHTVELEAGLTTGLPNVQTHVSELLLADTQDYYRYFGSLPPALLIV